MCAIKYNFKEFSKTYLKFMSKMTFRIGQFPADRRGAAMMVFAIIAVPMVAISGMGVDAARAFAVKQRLGQAIDAAGLAVGAATGTEEELRAVMQRYFDANYSSDAVGVPAQPQLELTPGKIRITATADVDATLLKVVGIDSITVGAESEITLEQQGLEVALVLDTTGSMAGSKINSLKEASRTFLDILFAGREEAEKLFVGVVPFAATVNIGPARLSFTNGPALSNYNADPGGWRGCVEARSYAGDLRDTKDVYASAAGRWPRYFFPQNGNFNSWPPVYGSGGHIRGPNKNCVDPLLPLNNRKSDIRTVVDNLRVGGLTHIALGAIWGHRLLSPEAPFTEGHAYENEEYNKAVVIMTDGANTSYDPNQNIYNRYYTAYGEPRERRLGNSASAIVSAQNARLTETCTNMKNDNIIVYTITFQVNSSSARNLMRNCATSTSHYFDSPSAEALRANFSAIATQLGNLRLSM